MTFPMFWQVDAVDLLSRLLVILVEQFKIVENPGFDCRIIDWSRNFNTVNSIPCHKIGRSNIHLRVIFAEYIDSGMFQKSSDYADDPDIIRLSCHTCFQTADSTHDHADFHACFTGLDKLVDDLLIRQGIDFHTDITFFSFLRLCNFFINHCKNFILQAVRSYKQMLCLIDGSSH